MRMDYGQGICDVATECPPQGAIRADRQGEMCEAVALPFKGTVDGIMNSFLAGGPDVQKNMYTGSSSILCAPPTPYLLIGWNSGIATGMQFC